MSIDQLQRIAYETGDLRGDKVTIKSALVNNNSCFDIDSDGSNGDLEKHLSMEMVSYVVLEAGSQSISGGL